VRASGGHVAVVVMMVMVMALLVEGAADGAIAHEVNLLKVSDGGNVPTLLTTINIRPSIRSRGGSALLLKKTRNPYGPASGILEITAKRSEIRTFPGK
jgi:hypothetical protein